LGKSKFVSRIPIEFVISNDLTLTGELHRVLSPRTIDRLLSKMPVNSRIHLWKKELYFEVGIRMGAEKAVTKCNGGDIAYWPQGDAVCLFFQTMTPYSKVSPLGQFTSVDFEKTFEKLHSGMPIKIRQIKSSEV
jgi:hypothetical protein